jgi:hypothetical protein
VWHFRGLLFQHDKKAICSAPQQFSGQNCGAGDGRHLPDAEGPHQQLMHCRPSAPPAARLIEKLITAPIEMMIIKFQWRSLISILAKFDVKFWLE